MPTIKINDTRYEYNIEPDNCPMCHYNISPQLIQTNLIDGGGHSGEVLQLIFRCPRRKCQNAFIAVYWQEFNLRYQSREGAFLLRFTAPRSPKELNIPTEIIEISPNYKEIMEQSATTEHHQLGQISGMGYRKALEFLIKDYAIYKNPGSEENVKKLYLGNCIEEYIDDANIKECAKRAAWLGNDETHYLRIWEEKDIDDLKTLLRLTEAWVLNNLLTEKYMEEME